MGDQYKRGEVYFADLNPVVGCEQGGIRPVVIVQNDIGNKHSPTVIVAPMTTKDKKTGFPTHVHISASEGIREDSVVMMEALRTVDKSRLKYCVCELSADSMRKIDEALKVSLNLKEDFLRGDENLNELQVFSSSEFGEVRTVVQNGEPMFCLADVCRILEIKNVSDCKSRLREDGVGSTEVTDSLGRRQRATFVNEANLYKIIFQSRKESAERFTDWVTSEVLPSIRKNGGYIAGQENLSDEELLERAVLVAQKKIAERDKIIEQQRQQIEQDRPKTIFADAVSASHTSILVGDLAKLICQNGVKIGQKRLFEWLRQNNYLIKSGLSRNMPQQRYIEQGLFEVKESTVQNPDGSVRITRTPKITGKGQVYFVNKFIFGCGR